MEELMATDILLNEIILPDLKINNATIEDSVSELMKPAKSNDTRDVLDGDKGIQIVIAEDEIREHHPEALSSRISLELKDVPLVEAIRYTTGLTGLKFTIEPNIVTIQPKQSPEGTLFTRHYFLAVPLRDTKAQEFLEAGGVEFQGDAIALYIQK